MSFFVTTQNYQSFDPRLFPGLFLWNDANQITGVANGATLPNGSWSNLAPDFRYAYTGAASTGATYQTNVLNGLPVMRFTTAQEYRFHSSILALNDCSLFFVSRLTGTSNGRIFQSSNCNILYGYWGAGTPQYKNGIFVNGNPNAYNIPPAIFANTSWDVLSFTASQKGPFYFANYGSTILTGTTSQGPRFSGLTINSGWASGEDSTCEVAEILCYSNQLPLDQTRAVEGYLAWKWGQQTTLPAYHPFRNAPPFLQRMNPLSVTEPPFIWFDAQYTRNIITSGTNILNWSTLGTAGVSAVSNAQPTGQFGLSGLNGASTVRLTTTTWMSYTATTFPAQARSLYFITTPTTTLTTTGGTAYLALLQTSNVATGLQNYFYRDATGFYLTCGPNGSAFNVGFTLSNFATNSPGFYSLIDAQNTSFNAGTENGRVPTSYTFNTTSNYNLAGGAYILHVAAYGNAQDLGEYLYYGYDSPPAERIMLEGYMAWRWGQTSLLPLFHAFRNYAPSVPFFSPLNINTCNTTSGGRNSLQCVFWMDAAQEGGSNGSIVNSFTDKSGSGYVMTAAPTNATTLVTNGLAGKPYYNMGSSRFSTNNFVWRTKFTCAVVTNSAVGYFGLSQTDSATNSSYRNYIFQGNWSMMALNNNGITWEDSAIAQNNSVVGGAGWNICIWQYNNTGNPDWRRNGSVRATRLISGTAQGDTTNSGILWINGNSNASFDSSQVAEILIYNDFLNTAQNQKLEGYLAWKWGLVNNLPGNHPYRTQPP